MLESLAAWVLNTYIGDYVENLSIKQLSFALLQGKLELENLPLKKDALKKLNLPVEVRSGFIGRVHLQIPVSHLKSQPWVITLEKLYLVAGPIKTKQYNEADEKELEWARKHSQLTAQVEQWRNDRKKKDTGYSWWSMGTSLASNIVENLQLNVKDVHLRYEDETCIPDRSFACGVIIKSLSAQSTSEQGVPMFVGPSTSDMRYKLVDLQDFSVYWDTNTTLLGDLPREQLMEQLERNVIHSSHAQIFMDHEYLVEPVSAQAKMRRNVSPQPLRIACTPRIALDITLDKFVVALSERQYRDMVLWMKEFDRYDRAYKYRKWRPTCSIHESPSQWWKFAITAQLETIHNRNQRHSMEYTLTRVQEINTYAEAFTEYLALDPRYLDDELKAQMEEVEQSWTYEEMRGLREVLFDNFSREEKQPNVLTRPTPSRWRWLRQQQQGEQGVEIQKAAAELPEQDVCSPESATDRPGLFSYYFPGWTSSKAVDKTPGEEEAEAHAQWQIEQEIMDVLQDNAENNTLLKRDSVFAHLNFKLEKGTLRLLSSVLPSSSTDICTETILELVCDAVGMVFESRPRTKGMKFSISVGGLYLRDHITTNSIMPVLVAPQIRDRGFLGGWHFFTPTVSPNDDRPNYTQYGDVSSLAGCTADLFTLTYEQNPFHSKADYKLEVKTKPLDIVCNPAAIKRVMDFFAIQHRHGLRNRDLAEVAKLHYQELKKQTQAEIKETLDQFLEGNEQVRAKRWDCELDISAPQFILAENFTDPHTMMVVFDLGHLHFRNKAAGIDPQFRPSREPSEDTDDDFVTPCSSPPTLASETEGETEDMSDLLGSSELSESDLYDKIYDKYTLNLCDVQMMVGKVGREHWKYAHLKGTSPLHIINKFTISLQLERRLLHTCDPKWPKNTLSGTVQSLVLNVNEQKIRALHTCINLLTSEMSPPSSEVHMSASQKSMRSTPRDSTVTTDSSLDIGSLYRACSKSITSIPDATAEDQQRSLVAESRLVLMQFGIRKMSLQLQSRGRSVAEVHVGGVKANFTKRVYDMSLGFTVHSLLVADAMQTFGPDYELLIASHKNICLDTQSGSLRDSEPNSPSSPQSPNFPASPGEPVKPLGTSMSTSLISIQSAVSSAIQTLANSIPGSIDTVSLDMGHGKASSPRSLTQGLDDQKLSAFDPLQMQDSEALIKVELEVISPICPTNTNEGETLHIANIQINNLDVIANQQTLVELISFVKRAIPQADSTSQFQAFPQGSHRDDPNTENDDPAELESTSRWEVHADFNRLSMMMMRVIEMDGFFIARKVATATMSQAQICATVARDMKVEGSLGGLQLVNLTPECSRHQKVFSVGLDPSMTPTSEQKTQLNESLFNDNVVSEKAFTFMFAKEHLPCHDRTSSSHLGQNFVLTLRMASLCYTHSPQFLHEMTLCMTEFREYMLVVGRSIKERATEVARTLVTFGTEFGTGLSHYGSSESLDMTRRQRQRFADGAFSQENSVDMSRHGNDQLTLFNMKLDAILQTPVILLPRSSNSSQVLVLHLGRISVQNAALRVPIMPPLFPHSFDFDTASPANPADDKIFVEVRDMTIYSIDLDKQQDLERRLSRGINQFSTPQPGGYTKTSYGTPILHNTCIELNIELGQMTPAVCVKFNIGVTDDDVTDGMFAMQTQEDGATIRSVESDEILHVEGKVVTPLRLVLSKHVYEQLLETVNHLTPSSELSPPTRNDSSTTLLADSSELLDLMSSTTCSASNISRSSSHDQTATAPPVTTSSKTIALSVITVKFAMPVFNIQLTGDVGDGEEGFLDMKFQEFLVNMEKSDPYITSVNISLRSLIVEDLLEHKDSKHRLLVTSYGTIRRRSSTSSDGDKRFCSTSCPTSMLETPLPNMPNSLPSVFCEENVFADFAPKYRSSNSAGRMETRRSISLVSCPTQPAGRTKDDLNGKMEEEEEEEDLLVHIRVVLVDKKSPQFDTTYKKISRFVTVDFNRLDTTINLQTWVVLLDFLGMGATVDNSSTKSDDRATSTPLHDTRGQPRIVILSESGGMPPAKVNMKVDIAVASLSLLLNKSDYELAQVNVCGFTSQVALREGNVSVKGQLTSISLRDESPHARLYRERFITTGSQALNFEFLKFGTPDPNLHRDFDMSVKLRMTSVCYVHTQRFLLETLAYCQHFLQLQHLLGQMRAASAGWKVMERAVRSLRVHLDIEAGAPKILIPHSSNSTDILVVNLGTLSVSNIFAIADSLGTVREREATESRKHMTAMTQSVYGNLDHDWRANADAESPVTPSQFNVATSESNSTLNSFYTAIGTSEGSASVTGICSSQNVSPPEGAAKWFCGSTELDPANYKCLLDVMRVELVDIDLFAAQWRCKEFGGAGGTAGTEATADLLEFPSYFVQRQEQKLLKRTCKLMLQIERNLESEISHTSPDMRIDGTLTAVQCSLDLCQYQLIKGMLMHNIGEEVGEFQRPLMSHLQDPQMQTILSGQVWNSWSMNLNLNNVTLELLRSRSDDHETEVPLAQCDFIKSHLLFKSFSDGTKEIDLVSHEIVIHDTRYRDAPANARPNVFSKILQPSKNCTYPNALQMELHYRSTKESTRFTVLLNNMRLMGVFDWLLALRDFIMVEVTNPFENVSEGGRDIGSKCQNVSAHTVSAGVISKRATYVEQKESLFEFKLNVTDTEFVVVEDTTAWDTNAVILKCTAVLMYCPYQYKRPLTCSLQSLEVFSCCLAAEDETALSIIDPVTVAMELNNSAQLHKINSPPAGLLDATSPLDRPPVLEVCLSSVNIRLSYNDIKLFLAIMDSMPKQLLQASEQSLPPRNKAHSPHPEWQVMKLKALGFSEFDCEQALTECSNCMDDAVSWLIQHATPVPSSQCKKDQKRSNALSGIEMKADGLCICFIDDCQDADVPLAELNFTNLCCLHRLSGYGNSEASFRLTGDYYNRSLSGWEPFLETWRCQLNWENGILDDANKVILTAKDVLNLNITSVLLNLYETTSVKWTEDYYKDTVSRTSEYLSSSRRRTPFVPFALQNNTGSELWFTTVTTTPSRMESPVSPGRPSIGLNSSHESNWKHVRPGEEVSFLIEERQKTRHKNTHELRVHKLVVKVAGWKEVSPLSVDKVGVYFREARPELDKSSAIFTEVPPARIVFDVTVGSSAKKLITVRSALVVHNRLDDSLEVLLENTLSHVGAKDMVMRVDSGRRMAMPLSMVHCKVRARPFAHSLRWCHRSTLWQHVEKAGDMSNTITSCDTVNGPVDSYRFCIQVRRLHYPPDKAIRRSATSLQQSSIYGHPGHVITFMPPVRVDNLLPVDLMYYIKGTDINGTIKPGRIAPLVTADITQALELGVELENFPSCKELVIPAAAKDYKVKLRLYDTVERLLALSVHIKAGIGGSLKLSVSAPYWLVNKTGLPLVFKQDGCSESAAGQFEEHELARSVTPLSFCYARRDQPMFCSMKLGKSVKGPETVPQWCHKFSLERGIGVRQLHVISSDARPDWVYNIGIEVRQGRGRYCDTNIITFTPRYQLDNRSQYKLAFAQRHLVSGQNPSVDDYLSALPSCTLSFHWPRVDLDQLLCVRMMGDPHCYWSGGFRIDTVDSFHINMRGERNCCMFLRVDIVLHGATYFVVFTDADQMPPPYRIDNYCEVSLVYYQTKVTEDRLRSHIKARTSVPYAWDEPMLPPYLTLSVPGGTSATYNMHVLEEGAQLCYENFIYIAFTATFRSSSLVKGTAALWKSYDAFVESQELVLDVLPGDKVVLKRKEQGKRSQLWRMTSQGMLQHEGSSAPRDPRIKKTSANDVTYVLDIADIALRPSVEMPLILRKPDERRKTTQTWKFTEDGRLCCGPNNKMCVQSKEGVFGLRDGGEAVLGPTDHSVKTKVDLPLEMMVGRQKMRPGSGFLSVKVITDGPTRVLQIIDVTHENYLSRTSSDWVLIEQERQRPHLREGHRLSITRHRDEHTQNLEVEVSLKEGVGISLVNHIPEELVYVTLKNIEVKLSSTSGGQILDASVGKIQVDNQLFGTYQPVLLFVTPPNAESPIEPVPALQVYAHRIPNKKWNAYIYKEFVVTLTRMTLHIEEKLLWKLLQLSNFHKMTSELDGLDDDENSYNSQRALSAAVSATLKRYYFGCLRIKVNRITMSMLTCSQLPNDLLTIKKTLGMPLVKFENAKVELDPFEHNHQFETSAFLLELIKLHYTEELKGQAAKILGSVDFLGNPLGLFNDVTEGIYGLIDGNVGGLLKSVTHGVSNSAAKVAGTLSDSVGIVALDERHQLVRQEILRETMGNSRHHLMAGVRGFTHGILGGLTSIVTQTYTGTMESGFEGLITGFGKGVVGTVAKPIAGVLDLASGAASAVRDTSRTPSHRVMLKRVRQPRCCFGPRGLLPVYSEHHAKAQEYLFTLNKNNYGEMFIAIEQLQLSTEDSVRALLSSERVYFLGHHHLGSYNIMLDVPYNKLYQCRALPYDGKFYIELTMKADNEMGVPTQDPRKRPKVRCDSEHIAQMVTSQILYAKNLYDETKQTLSTDDDSQLDS